MGHVHRADICWALHAVDYFLCNLDGGHAGQAGQAETNGGGVIAVALIFGPLQDHFRQFEFGQVTLLLCFFNGFFNELDDIVADHSAPRQ